MNTVWTSLQSTTVELLVLTLLNSLWQGAIWLLMLMLVLRTIPARRVDLRYALAVGSLLGIVVTLLVTWSLLSGAWRDAALTNGEAVTMAAAQSGVAPTVSPSEHDGMGGGQLTVAEATSMSAAMRAETMETDRARDWIVISAVIWACGCLLMLVRCLLSFAAARGLLRGRTCDRQELL